MSQPPSAPPPPPPPPDYGGGYGGYGGQEPYGQPYQPGGQSSTKAIVSLVLAIVSFFVCGLILSIPAVFLGRSAQREIDASGGRIGGRGMATAGYVVGLINVVISVIVIIVVIIVFASGAGGNV